MSLHKLDISIVTEDKKRTISYNRSVSDIQQLLAVCTDIAKMLGYTSDPDLDIILYDHNQERIDRIAEEAWEDADDDGV